MSYMKREKGEKSKDTGSRATSTNGKSKEALSAGGGSLLPFQVYILLSSCTLDVSVLQTIGQKISTIKRGSSLSRENGQGNSFEKEIFDKKLKETK